MRAYIFSLKLFDTVVILKYGRSLSKWNEQLKLNEQYRHAQFDIEHIYGVSENPKVIVSNKPTHFSNQKHINYLPWIHSSVAQTITCVVASTYVTNTQHLNYSEQQSD